MKKLIPILALFLALAACVAEAPVPTVTRMLTVTPLLPTVTPLQSTATPMPPTITPVPWDGEVSALATGLRQQPQLNPQVIKTLTGGTKVDLLATTEDQKWVRVTAYFEGTRGVGWLQVDKLKLNVSLDDLEVVTETVSSPEGDQPAATPGPGPTPLGGGGKIAFVSFRDGNGEIYLMGATWLT